MEDILAADTPAVVIPAADMADTQAAVMMAVTQVVVMEDTPAADTPVAVMMADIPAVDMADTADITDTPVVVIHVTDTQTAAMAAATSLSAMAAPWTTFLSKPVSNLIPQAPREETPVLTKSSAEDKHSIRKYYRRDCSVVKALSTQGRRKGK